MLAKILFFTDRPHQDSYHYFFTIITEIVNAQSAILLKKKILILFMPAGCAHFQIEYLGILSLYQPCCSRMKLCPDVNSRRGTLGRHENICTSWKRIIIPIYFKLTATAHLMSRQSLYRACVWLQFTTRLCFAKKSLHKRVHSWTSFCYLA